MDKLVVEGGRPLEGTVRCAGAKNAVLPVLAASLLTDEPVRVENAPDLADVATMLDLLGAMGARVDREPDGTVELCFADPPEPRAPWEYVRRMRGSVCVLGPLLGRLGRAEVSLPGGCVFGVRPIDVHIKGMEALGASVRVEHGYVIAEAPAPPGSAGDPDAGGSGLRGSEVFLGTPFGSSVTGTMNVLLASVLAEGTTIIEGAACEPEVEDLGRCLVAMGARIEGLGSPRLAIEGVERLRGTTHRVIPDRIEAGTYLVAGAITGGRVRVEGCRPAHLSSLLDRLWQAGMAVERGPDWVETQSCGLGHRPRPTDVTTQAFPGFPTDLQAQWMALMTLADGFSIITERIYPDRYMHVAELARLGAVIRRQGSASVVQGVGSLSGAEVMASDLRASAALVLAGLVARGRTDVHRVYHIDRGYERIEERLQALGARIERVVDDE